ncbi:hypothetical protein [uncultured Alteromonas sp.]|jgi:hypothetical protein|uniref:hypothetical protein n=1 Tax=uncultured Alteromonas sp. TaxID=179113 RepID=UPI0030ECF836|tara:strand:- start:22118 stop:23989 length:1872 start_codon:yes stop_codon:yes gene_type:complete
MKISCSAIILFSLSFSVLAELPPFVLEDERELTTVNFRYAEGSLRTQKSAAWIKRWGSASGIVLKALNEEVRPFEENTRTTLSLFREQYPDQLMLLHFNGRSRLPTFAPENMKASDFLYLLGTTNTTSISDKDSTSLVSVSDVKAFKRNRAIQDGVYDDVVLVHKNTDGTLNWDKYEHAKLIKVDPATQTITIKRDLLKQGKQAFDKGQAYIALHAAKGPFDKTVKQRLWEYNWFYGGITKSSEYGLSNRLGNELGTYLLQDMSFFNGITLDVLTEYHQPKIGGYPGPIDANQDGLPDKDEISYDLWHKEGVYQFLSALRNKVKDTKLILADGGYIHQKAVHILNGMESEGWPNNEDGTLEHWSSGLNRYTFWSKFSQKPSLNYVRLAEYWTEDRKRKIPPDNIRRLTVVAAMMTDTVIVPGHRPRGIHYQKWPEFKSLRDLGKPIGKLKHYAADASISVKTKVGKPSKAHLEFPTLNFRNNKVSSEHCFGVSPKGGPVTVSVDATKQGGKEATATLIAKPDKEDARFSLVSSEAFTSWFYWDDMTSEEICFASSDGKALSLNALSINNSVLISYREYENGIVFTNPFNKPVNILPSDISVSGDYNFKQLTVPADDILIQKKM